MKFRTRPFSPLVGVEFPSDVERLEFGDGKLSVLIASSLRADGKVRGFDIVFDRPTGFRLLDELALHRYWSSDEFARGRHVVEVDAGGWADEEKALAGWDNKKREWLVVTGNDCVSVFCDQEPSIKETAWPLNR